MDDTLLVASVLVANGLTVVQYDPLDHVGSSDGGMGDYTYSRHCGDLLGVMRRWAELDPVVMSFGVSALPTLRALVAQPTRGAVLVAPIVAILRTLVTITGRDWRAAMRDSGAHASAAVENEVGAALLRDPERRDYADEELLIACASVLTQVDVIADEQGGWVDPADIRRLAEVLPNGRVVTVADIEGSAVVSLQFLARATAAVLNMMGSDEPFRLPSLTALRDVWAGSINCRTTEQRIRSPATG